MGGVWENVCCILHRIRSWLISFVCLCLVDWLGFFFPLDPLDLYRVRWQYLMLLLLSTENRQSTVHHHHFSQNREGRWGTTDDFTISFLHFPLFSTAFCDFANSRPVHSLMSSHLFLCLPCLLPLSTVPCKMVLARPDERETCPYHCSLRLFTMVRRTSCGPIAYWILARTSSLVTWSLYDMRSILR